mmetsp:Transcript_62259/g.167908  ORF Transcript_62259/g.167908 Transcript_62259/m.167908 type:complete len:346 (+) Transcript_62259:1249-2286(+)
MHPRGGRGGRPVWAAPSNLRTEGVQDWALSAKAVGDVLGPPLGERPPEVGAEAPPGGRHVVHAGRDIRVGSGAERELDDHGPQLLLDGPSLRGRAVLVQQDVWPEFGSAAEDFARFAAVLCALPIGVEVDVDLEGLVEARQERPGALAAEQLDGVPGRLEPQGEQQGRLGVSAGALRQDQDAKPHGQALQQVLALLPGRRLAGDVLALRVLVVLGRPVARRAADGEEVLRPRPLQQVLAPHREPRRVGPASVLGGVAELAVRVVPVPLGVEETDLAAVSTVLHGVPVCLVRAPWRRARQLLRARGPGAEPRAADAPQSSGGRSLLLAGFPVPLAEPAVEAAVPHV